MALANFSAAQVNKAAEGGWNDVIPLHEITKVDGLEELIGEEAARDEQGLFAIHTSRSGSTLGRKYCLQVVGMIPPPPTASALSLSESVNPKP